MRAHIIPASLILTLITNMPAALVAQSEGPPPTPVRAVTDTFFGTTVVDPYRWLENLQDSAVIQWFHAQQDYTRRTLDALPSRAALAARIHDLSNAGPTVDDVQIGGAHLFYLKRLPGEDVAKLYVRDSLEASERPLVDPERFRRPEGPPWSINYFTPSWDGRYVAYGASEGGSEDVILRVIEVTSGRVLADSIDRVQLGAIAWRPEGRSFFYNRLQALPPGAPPAERYRNSRAYLHVLGQPDSTDVAVLGTGISPQLSIGEDDIPVVMTFPGSEWAVATTFHGVRNEISAHVAPLTAVRDGAAPWQPLVEVADSVTQLDVHGDDVYLLTHAGAPRFKVVRTSLRAPDPRRAELVLPETRAVVRAIGVARDALYIQTLDGGLGRLQRLAFVPNAEPTAIPLPFDGAIGMPPLIPGLVTNGVRPGALVLFQSWTHPPLWYWVDAATGRLRDSGLLEASSVDYSDITAQEIRVPSGDGTMVPMSIVYRRDLRRDGSNPTLLVGYGAYGISIDPTFLPTYLAWLERGGILAVCHARGGGEFGETWHQAGRGPTKPNTWRDLIACGEYLVREDWTSPARLAGIGASAGGILIGMAVNERPDLFQAAVARVGAMNPVREMLVGVGGPSNRPEFGDPTTPSGFSDLLAMDPYLNVREGTAYPAMLLTTGMNDPRVDPWAPAKMAARVQAATSSGRPVLLRVEFEAGHGLGSAASQREAELTDIFAFLLWQFRVADFQPD